MMVDSIIKNNKLLEKMNHHIIKNSNNITNINKIYNESIYFKINKNIIDNINNSNNNKSKNINILSRNLRGISNKIELIKKWIDLYKVNIIAVQECWLDYSEREVECLPNINNYNKEISVKSRLCYYIRNDIIYKRIKFKYKYDNINRDNNYFLIIAIEGDKDILYIINWYRPRPCKKKFLEINDIILELENRNNNNKKINIILVGDINSTHEIMGAPIRQTINFKWVWRRSLYEDDIKRFIDNSGFRIIGTSNTHWWYHNGIRYENILDITAVYGDIGNNINRIVIKDEESDHYGLVLYTKINYYQQIYISIILYMK